MAILQSVTRKQIGIKDNPERFQGVGYAPGFPIIDELDKKIKRCFKGEWLNIELKDSSQPKE